MRPVRLLGSTVDWHDGSEQRVVDIIEGATDRSDGSDELAAHMDDWPTTYHFSPRRANLLRPVRFGPGTRVLDVGAGSGALARYVAETGASVVALEGNRARAEAAARRCAGLDSVEVVCGPLTELVDPIGFDVVLCVGVLEHTAPAHERTLDRLRRLTVPGGALVLAIENQLGLRYLLGHHEDHLLEPWIGVEGYPGTDRVRTFSRDRLRRMLEEAGFPDQRWLFPFPDYKLPVAVLAERAYEGPHGGRLVDQLVRWPSATHASPEARVCDVRLAHSVFLDGGLGPEVANSFLVVAGRGAASLAERVDTDVAAWFFGADRARAWRSTKTFRLGGGGGERAEVVAKPRPAEAQRGVAWLRQERPDRQPFFVGPTLEQLFLKACAESGEEAQAVLRAWRDHLGEVETPAAADAGPGHPFRTTGGRALLPPDHLDVNLANFVQTDSGLVFVDREWVAEGGVDADVVLLRALWGLATDMVRHGVVHPWPAELTVDGLAGALGRACGVPAGAAELDAWRRSEAELLAVVHGGAVKDHLDWLARTGRTGGSSGDLRRSLPFTALRRDLAATQHRLKAVAEGLAGAEAQVVGLHAELVETRDRLASVERDLEVARADAATLASHLSLARRARAMAEAASTTAQQRIDRGQPGAERARAELDAHIRRWNRIERRYPVRLYRRLRPTGQAPRRAEVAAGPVGPPDLEPPAAVTSALPIPPLAMRQLVGPTDEGSFDNPSGGLVFPELAAGAYDAVFDFGCGCGRLARQLMQQRPRPARYVGIDLHAGMVDWCRRQLAPAAPGFDFLHHDVFNPSFNPGSEKRPVAPFPVEDAAFSLVIAWSVFTHLTQDQVPHYLGEVARVLRPGGTALTTWFLFEKSDVPMMQDFQNALYINLVDPTNAVIFDRAWVRETAAAAGLTIVGADPPTLRGYQWRLWLAPAADGDRGVELPPDVAPRGSLPSPLMPDSPPGDVVPEPFS